MPISRVLAAALFLVAGCSQRTPESEAEVTPKMGGYKITTGMGAFGMNGKTGGLPDLCVNPLEASQWPRPLLNMLTKGTGGGCSIADYQRTGNAFSATMRCSGMADVGLQSVALTGTISETETKVDAKAKAGEGASDKDALAMNLANFSLTATHSGVCAVASEPSPLETGFAPEVSTEAE